MFGNDRLCAPAVRASSALRTQPTIPAILNLSEANREKIVAPAGARIRRTNRHCVELNGENVSSDCGDNAGTTRVFCWWSYLPKHRCEKTYNQLDQVNS